MTKRTVLLWAFVALVLGTLTFVACGGDKNLPTGDTGIPTSSGPAPVASNPQPVNPPATGAPGILVTLVSTTFDANSMCTDLSKPEHAGKTELVEVAKITNNTDREVYPFPAIFHSKEAGCGATGDNPGGTTGLITGGNIAPGQTGEWTHRFKIPERNLCGRYQFDNDARNGEISKSTFQGGVGGVVINTGVNCPDCTTTNVQVFVSGEGLTRTVKVTFAGEKPGKKATVDFGDGTSAQLANGGSVEHTWPYGSYTVTASLSVDGLDLPCTATTTVKNEKPCEVEWIEQEPEVTYGEWGECKANANPTASNGESQCSQSRSVRTVIKEKNSCTGEVRVKSDKTTTESRPCECACVPEWKEQEPEVTYGEWGECKAPETSSSTVRPACSQSRSVRTVIKEKNSCTGEVRVKSDKTTTESRECQCKEDSCDNYTPPTFGGALALTSQTATQVTVTSGTVTPAGGSFSPTLPSVQSRPPAGSGDATFETDYTMYYGPAELKCKAEHEYTIKIPQQEQTCTPVHTDQVDGCYKPNPWGEGNNPSDICSYFGLVPTAKDEVSQGGTSWTLTHAANMAVAHWGGSDCERGAQYYQFVNPASAGQVINSPGKGGISYVQYCGCSAQASSNPRYR